MSVPKQKLIKDDRRTLTPSGAKIAVDPSGFSVRLEDDVIADVRWSQVKKIFAYTRFIQGQSSHLCLAFVLPPISRGKEDQVVVHSGVLGWQSLTAALAEFFASINAEWVRKASGDTSAAEAGIMFSHVPSFTVNPVQVWPAE